jgi:hypothetical protein
MRARAATVKSNVRRGPERAQGLASPTVRFEERRALERTALETTALCASLCEVCNRGVRPTEFTCDTPSVRSVLSEGKILSNERELIPPITTTLAFSTCAHLRKLDQHHRRAVLCMNDYPCY